MMRSARKWKHFRPVRSRSLLAPRSRAGSAGWHSPAGGAFERPPFPVARMDETDPRTSFASHRLARHPGRGTRFARRLLGIGIFLVAVAAIFAVVTVSL